CFVQVEGKDPLTYFAEMKEQGVSPDSEIYAMLLVYHGLRNETEQADELLKEMLEQKITPDLPSLQVVLALHLPDMKKAREILEIARGFQYPLIQFYGIMIESAIKDEDDVEEALEIYEDAIKD